MKRTAITLFSALAALPLLAQSVTTERQYLSGKGADDMVEWDFKVSDGNNSGKWSKIGVPSNWELQGFGNYQYGMKFYGKAFPEGVADETGTYRYEFELPESWRGRQVELVFDGSMTDTYVTINGRKAGSKHQGGFYRFIYDVSDRVFFGPKKKNRIEVVVNKESENAGVNLAERRADYWNFGGIFRPVFMQSRPALNLKHIAIDAKADGAFTAACDLNFPVEGGKVTTIIYDAAGKKVAEKVTDVRKGASEAKVELKVPAPKQWTAESPNMYKAEFILVDAKGKVLHKEYEKFGFRTIEVRESDGLYINGKKVQIRGVNRHSFRPETGRTLSFAKNLEDVKLIKSMNMNAVRLSHYPADPEFYQICDSLGLYVMSELTGWHGKHETINGQKLVKEMVERDVNHPSIIWWSNGNEGGWNDELNGEFHKYDPQKRPVLHPQGNFGGFETMHYRSYGESQDYMRKPEIFMPTEFLHGLYDGGHGAGLYDYWEMMRKAPRCAGGFLWVLADEGVKRVDMNGFIDNCGNYGADGIVGPHHEKEGSYWTIKQLWSPIQIMNKEITSDFNGVLDIENRYDFTSLNGSKLTWKQLAMPTSGNEGGVQTIAEGTVKFGDIAPRSAGTVTIPALKPAADALELTVTDYNGDDLFTWSYPVVGKEKTVMGKAMGAAPTYTENNDEVVVSANGRTFHFSKKDGQLKGVDVDGKNIPFKDGPRVIVAKRSDRSMDGFYNHDDPQAEKKKTQYTEFADKGNFTGLTVEKKGNDVMVRADYKLGNLDNATWYIAPDGTATLDYEYNFGGVVDLMGVKFDFPEERVVSKKWVGNGPYRVWQNRLHGPQYGLWENDYNDPIPAESFDYPEFKGYFSNVDWMDIKTQDGTIEIVNETPGSYVGVYEPRDGKDHILYTLPKTGIAIMDVIPPVRNKVNTTDLNGPSAQPKWVSGPQKGRVVLRFNK